ncbi:MAG: lipopolysaccharide biosynthesis protein [Breznakia sp.]
MNNRYDCLIREKSTIKKSIFWYTMGSLCNTVSSVLLLMYVTRILGQNDAGVFSIAWAIVQLVLTIGLFNTRDYQVSDTKTKYRFQEYLSLKLFTSLIAIGCGILYSMMLGNYGYKLLVTFLLCVLFVSDIFADCFSGFFQQHEKLHIAGKSNVIRIVFYNLSFLFSLLYFHSLIVSIVLAFLVSSVWIYMFDFQIVKRITTIHFAFQWRKMLTLLKACFPLFLGNFLTIFLINIPKNTMNHLYTSDMQALYAVLFMPSALTNMFCMFIFVPLFTSITKRWHQTYVGGYIALLFKLLLMIILVNVCVLLGGYILGIPILKLVFNVDVSGLKTPMMLLLLAGGFTSMNNVLNFSVAVMRKQHYIICGYLIAVMITYGNAHFLIQKYELLGAAFTYLLGISMVTASLLVINVALIYKRYQGERRSSSLIIDKDKKMV